MKKDSERRKMVRGNVISDEIVQINTKIVEKPKKPAERKVETQQEEA